MGIDEDIGVDGDHKLTRLVDEVPDLFPVSFANAWLEPFTLDSAGPILEALRDWIRVELTPERSLDNLLKGFVFAPRLPLRAIQEVISNINGRLHMAHHIRAYGSLSMHRLGPPLKARSYRSVIFAPVMSFHRCGELPDSTSIK